MSIGFFVFFAVWFSNFLSCVAVYEFMINKYCVEQDDEPC